MIKQSIRFVFCFILFSIYFASCSNYVVPVDCIKSIAIDNYEEELLLYQESGVSIDSVNTVGHEYIFHFSNLNRIILSDTIVHPIDIRDGKQQEIIKRKCVIEGYENWSFYFHNGHVASIRKTLFETNPDEVIKGINHRGYSVDAPENTLPAYRLSKLKGFRYVEADVLFTKDNVPVLIHDLKVDRTSNGTGYVQDLLWDEIKILDFGQWKSPFFEGTTIPSLSDFLDLCRRIGLIPYIELKAGSKEQIESVVDLVYEYGLNDRTFYISFNPALLKYVLHKDPSASLGYLATSPLKENAIIAAKGLKIESNYVFIDSADYSIEAVQRCQKALLPLEVWTIDSEETILSLSPYITGVASNKIHAGRIRTQ